MRCDSIIYAMMKYSIFWFRRDLRLEDNAGLYHALSDSMAVRPIFIFDKQILDRLDEDDARVGFIHRTLTDIHQALNNWGSGLHVYYGDPIEVWKDLVKDKHLESVYTNRDYEPYAIRRDDAVREILAAANVELKDYKDHVIFDRDEVLKKDGTPYTVFTPYKRKWLEKVESGRDNPTDDSFYYQSYPSMKYTDRYVQSEGAFTLSLEDLGFVVNALSMPDSHVSQKLIKSYDETRDYPAIVGTSRLGLHFRFGTISIREKARKAAVLNQTYLSELVWRDFYSMILYHFPHVEKNAFREKYEAVEWRKDQGDFKAWCEGKTGYPIVDAGMRELNATGYMHNRVRMIVASFLTKHLLIDWRWGEAYFAEKLLDFDLASNNGGWQWAAGCGTDAAPYFRIFNPYTQQKKFDKDGIYTSKWVPEWQSPNYVEPIVDHKEARQRCLETYKAALG